VIDHDVIVNNFGRGCAWAVLGAAIGPQFILALMGKRASYAGTVAGMAVGCVVAIGW
jgi:Na+/proline symporter